MGSFEQGEGASAHEFGLPSVPEELKELSRWVVWDASKVPHDPRTGKRADTTDSSSWCDYLTTVAKRHSYAGIGCVIAPPYVGIDIDKCRDPESGQTEEWAQAIVDEANSYTEVSPSGKGFHIWVRGELPQGRRKAGRVEMYSKGRYFTVTGQHLPGTPLTVETRELKPLQSRLYNLDPNYKRLAEAKQRDYGTVTATGSRFDVLMAGEWQGLYPSQSEADAALCAILAAKHSCNPEQVDAEFRQSQLMRSKWDEKRGNQTYGQLTIRNAMELVNKGTSARQAGVRKPDEPVDWRAAFKSYDQMEQGEIPFLVKGVFPHNISLIGGLSATGKTWFTLSLALAMVSGKRFLGHFDVPAAVPVIYLIPESGERPFRARLDRMRLNDAGESFLCRTMHSGPILGLQSRELLEASRVLKPVVILDTAIRFSTAQDENSSSQNKALANGMFDLLTAGARGIIAIHHSPKSSATDHEMTLENTLRGTGDLGAMSDAVYALRCVNQETLELRVQCVKARDFEPVKPFHIQGRPFINENGNFGMLTEPGRGQEQTEIETLVRAIVTDLSADYRSLSTQTGIPLARIATVAGKAGWKKERNQPWSQPEKISLLSPEEMN